MADASPQELSKLQQAVKDFKDRYAIFSSTSYGAQIARSGDNELMQEYGNVLAKARAINTAVDTFANKWAGMKEYIGLAAVPIVPIAIVAGISATVLGGVVLIDRFMKKAGVKQIQKDNPGITYEAAVQRYNTLHTSTFEKALDTAQLAMLLGGAFLLFWFLSR